MHPFLKTVAAALIATAALQAFAIGRVADVTIIDRSTGQTLPIYQHGGEYWVAGQPGAKYAIQIRNFSGPRVLAVTSVDGLNVLSGATANYNQSGYVFDSRQRYSIEGWRKSDSQIAAFVFTDSDNSYAERVGKPRDVGVIGVALFRERAPVVYEAPPVISRPAPVPPLPPLRQPKNFDDNSQHKNSEAAPSAASPAPSPAPTAPAPAARSESAANSSSRAAESAAMDKVMPPITMPTPAPSPKLGTGHGEREASYVSRTNFVRNSATPDEVIRIRYDSHANLLSMGIIPSPRPWYGQAPNAFPGQPTSYVPDPPPYR
jgi:hypothetical protein